MDQESFRKLLHTPRALAGGSTPTQRGSLLAGASKAKKKIDASKPAFKPRTVKKKSDEGPYRDRATERRLGTDNDYAQVEALAEDFERRAAAAADRQAVEEQRKYLGGDSEHTVLVKGLDFALLAQQKSRLATQGAEEDDETLEQAFTEATMARKRTREEIIAELKNKRAKTDGGEQSQPAEKPAADLEEAKKAGKFRPIGFKPTGQGLEKKKKKKVEGEGKKKKKKVEQPVADIPPQTEPAEPAPTPANEAGPSKPTIPPEPEPEPMLEDFDIFADAGDYTGVDVGDDDDESADDDGGASPVKDEEREEGEAGSSPPPPPRRWVETEDDRLLPPLPAASASPSQPPPRTSASRSPAPGPSALAESDIEEGEEEEEERPMRLQPLASSAIPSIKDLLAMDTAVEKADKRRANKEKRKAGGGGEGGGKTDKDKLERDYKKLEAYQKKKAAAG